MIRHAPSPRDPEHSARRAKKIYNATCASVWLSGLGALPLGLWAHGLLPDFYLMFAALFLGDIAKGLATHACRRAGVSQESQHSEIIERGPGAALAPLLSEAPAFSLGELDHPWARISREGIEHKDWRGRFRPLSWQDVESCGFSASRDVVGNISNCLVLRGRDGKTLLQMHPSQQQAAHLLPAIRFYLRAEHSEHPPSGVAL